MILSTRFDSLQKLKSHCLRFSQGMRDVAHDTARTLIVRAESLAKERVRSKTQQPNMGTGKYYQSIKSEFSSGTGILRSDSAVAGILEFGSRPHIIRPKGDNFLFWPGAKHPSKEVKHPGTPAFRVLGSATEEAIEETGNIIESALKRKFD